MVNADPGTQEYQNHNRLSSFFLSSNPTTERQQAMIAIHSSRNRRNRKLEELSSTSTQIKHLVQMAWLVNYFRNSGGRCGKILLDLSEISLRQVASTHYWTRRISVSSRKRKNLGTWPTSDLLVFVMLFTRLYLSFYARDSSELYRAWSRRHNLPLWQNVWSLTTFW